MQSEKSLFVFVQSILLGRTNKEQEESSLKDISSPYTLYPNRKDKSSRTTTTTTTHDEEKDVLLSKRTNERRLAIKEGALFINLFPAAHRR